MSSQDLESLSDEELLASAQRVYMRSREFTVRLIRHLVVIEKRRLHLKTAHSSLYDFCLRNFRMSSSSASRYATAAKLAATYPQILESISTNQLHMSTLVRIRNFLTDESVDEMLGLVSGKSRDEIDDLLARLAPRPDAPSSMRKLPKHRTGDYVDHVVREIEAWAEERYRIQFIADRELRDDIEAALDLMRHSNPNGELAVLFRYCIRAGLERMRARSRGTPRSSRPRPANVDRPRKKIPVAVRRAVFTRDGDQCTFHAPNGDRCPSRAFLQLDHIVPRAQGGLDTVENLRVRCSAHNRLYAELIYGQAFVENRIRAHKAANSNQTNLARGLARAKKRVSIRSAVRAKKKRRVAK